MFSGGAREMMSKAVRIFLLLAAAGLMSFLIFSSLQSLVMVEQSEFNLIDSMYVDIDQLNKPENSNLELDDLTQYCRCPVERTNANMRRVPTAGEHTVDARLDTWQPPPFFWLILVMNRKTGILEWKHCLKVRVSTYAD